jgi:prepilin-type N-terminal cleavage/methylation domain-containing protein
LEDRISKAENGSARDAESFGLKGRKHHNAWGFTIIELMIVVAILGIIAGIGIPTYRNYLEKAKIVTAVAEIKMIMTHIEAYRSTQMELPADLSTVGFQDFVDPWGNPYQYVNLEAGGSVALGPSFASAKQEAKVTVYENRNPNGWSAARANGLYAAGGFFRKRFVKSVKETLEADVIKTTVQRSNVTAGGDRGNMRLLMTYTPTYNKNIMHVGSPLIDSGLILAKKAEDPNPPADPNPPEDSNPPEDPTIQKKANARQDRNGNPLNLDFDLYSMGRDGKTNKNLTHKHSEDDVIRGDSGSFVGPVERY